jgi:hypothetical protein
LEKKKRGVSLYHCLFFFPLSDFSQLCVCLLLLLRVCNCVHIKKISTWLVRFGYCFFLSHVSHYSIRCQ